MSPERRTHVNIIKLNVSRGRPAKIAKEVAQPDQVIISYTRPPCMILIVTNNKWALGDDTKRTYNQYVKWDFGLGFGEREDQKRNLVKINPKRFGDMPMGKVDLIALGASDLRETAIQCNMLLDKGNPSKDQGQGSG
jgi:hypothetical protein